MLMNMSAHCSVNLILVVLLSYTSFVIDGCSQLRAPTIQESIKYSHLVVTGQIQNVTADLTTFHADILCVLKDSNKTFHRSVSITQLASIEDGQCFDNDIRLHRSYILFLRELSPNVFRPYGLELPLHQLSVVAAACENDNTCRIDSTSMSHILHWPDCSRSQMMRASSVLIMFQILYVLFVHVFK